MRKKVIIATGLSLAVFLAFLVWYRAAYSMDVAKEREVGISGSGGQVLIATQGSAYKDAVVDGLLSALEPQDVYVKVIDVRGLDNAEIEDWDAIVVIHTWEMWKPEEHAARFFNAHHGDPKVIVLSTSGSGEQLLDTIDGISSASLLVDPPQHTARILGRINDLLAR